MAFKFLDLFFVCRYIAEGFFGGGNGFGNVVRRMCQRDEVGFKLGGRQVNDR